jgi:hypothetical protein
MQEELGQKEAKLESQDEVVKLSVDDLDQKTRGE